MRQTILTKEGEEKCSKTWTLEELNNGIKSAGEIKANDDLPEEKHFWNFEDDNLGAEEWREFFLKNNESWRGKYKLLKSLEVSNIGRVRITKATGISKIVKQRTYDKTNLELVDYRAFEYGKVYRLVALVWLKDVRPEGSKRWCVHHIDNDGSNNKPENLIWLSPEDHGKINHRK